MTMAKPAISASKTQKNAILAEIGIIFGSYVASSLPTKL